MDTSAVPLWLELVLLWEIASSPVLLVFRYVHIVDNGVLLEKTQLFCIFVSTIT